MPKVLTSNLANYWVKGIGFLKSWLLGKSSFVSSFNPKGLGHSLLLLSLITFGFQGHAQYNSQGDWILSTWGTERARVKNPTGWMGVGTNAPQGALDVSVTGAGSTLIVPRDTTANRPAAGSQVNGMIRYNTSTNKFEGYENGTWINFNPNPLTSIAVTAPLTSTGGTTPTIGITQASTSTNGYLSSSDWNTFNGKANVNSPNFTGVPTAPTAAVDTNTTQIATTAFVLGQAGSTAPIMDGVAAVGTSLRYSRADHVHPTDTSRAPAAGSASITTLGTITTGTWNGSIIGVPYGGTGTNNGSITGTGALTFAAGGTNQNVTLTPSGTGYTLLNGNVGIRTTAPGAALDVKGAIRLSGSTSGYSGFQPAAAAGSTVWTLPATDGGANQVLTTNGAGVLTWSTPAGTGVTTVTGTAPIVSSGGTAPAISITQAGTSSNGYLSSTDWNTFNNKAPTASPAFTGTPTAPTAAVNTNTTQLATTAFVLGQASSTSPAMNGVAAVGTGTTFARGDHVHPTDTSRAPAAGSSSITTVGTISSGTWNGSVIGVAYGGTGTNNGSITGTGALTFAAGGTGQHITLTPSAGGDVVLNGDVGIGTTAAGSKVHIVGGDVETENGYGLFWRSANGANFSDGAFIRFKSTGDETGSSYLEIGTTDNSDEPIIFTQTAAERMRIHSNGFVGIGTTAPGSNLDVNGTLRVTTICDRAGTNCQTPAALTSATTPTLATVTGNGATTSTAVTFNGGVTTTSVNASGEVRANVLSSSPGSTTAASIDFSTGNAVTTSWDCASGAISFSSLRNGGSYVLVVTSTSTTACSFSTTISGTDAATVAYRFNIPNGPRAASTHTVYNLTRVGTNVYVSWATGF